MTSRRLYKFDNDSELYTAEQIRQKLGKFTTKMYESRETTIDGHKIKLVKKEVYDFYINGELVLEGAHHIGKALERLGYNGNYYKAKQKGGLYIRRRWLVYDGKERSEKVQSTLL